MAIASSAVSTHVVSCSKAWMTKVPGCARADPKIATRYRSCFDGLSRVSVLTTFHKSRIVDLRTSLTASSSARLTKRDASW
jgi:hypothetical protein